MLRRENLVLLLKVLAILLLCYLLTKIIEARYFGQGLGFFFWQLEKNFKL